jgi:hypothetical protein
VGAAAMPGIRDALREEAAALQAALRRHNGAPPPLFPAPDMQAWRRWAGTSGVVRDPGTYFGVSTGGGTDSYDSFCGH